MKRSQQKRRSKASKEPEENSEEGELETVEDGTPRITKLHFHHRLED